MDQLGPRHAALRAGANDIALVATTSGGLANIDSLTVGGNGVSVIACN